MSKLNEESDDQSEHQAVFKREGIDILFAVCWAIFSTIVFISLIVLFVNAFTDPTGSGYVQTIDIIGALLVLLLGLYTNDFLLRKDPTAVSRHWKNIHKK
jgi:hypothetical protein